MSILVNRVFVFASLHERPVRFPWHGDHRYLFLSWDSLLLGFIVLWRLGPRHFPFRFLAGSSVRAVVLRQFLPVAAAAVLVFDIPERGLQWQRETDFSPHFSFSFVPRFIRLPFVSKLFFFALSPW
ncbi:MAG: hypothetical protein IPJ35_05235 [Elusimicrobia bacterium]|nr:hypothetical protein [Elusimicrobiota bacterium]